MSEGQRFCDFHNHVIPGVDDGASSEAESAAALHAFVQQGTRDIIATPHVDASLVLRDSALEQRLAAIDAGWQVLARLVERDFPGVHVGRGAEVMLDIPQPELSDPRMRLNGGAFALVEYPFMTVPPRSTAVLENLVNAGVIPIIAHPERYHGVSPDSSLPAKWRGAGAFLQLNAGSILGKYGSHAQAMAFALLEHGMADYICSDYHARGRLSCDAARMMLRQLGAHEQVEMLMSSNPRRMLAGEPPIPVPPLRRSRSVWQRVRGWFR